MRCLSREWNAPLPAARCSDINTDYGVHTLYIESFDVMTFHSMHSTNYNTYICIYLYIYDTITQVNLARCHFRRTAHKYVPSAAPDLASHFRLTCTQRISAPSYIALHMLHTFAHICICTPRVYTPTIYIMSSVYWSKRLNMGDVMMADFPHMRARLLLNLANTLIQYSVTLTIYIGLAK